MIIASNDSDNKHNQFLSVSLNSYAHLMHDTDLKNTSRQDFLY